MHERLHGPRVVNRIIRPPRVAFLVGSIHHCDFILQVCSLSWGGKHFCLIPYDGSEHLSEEWWRVLAAYDPDTVTSLVEVNRTVEERLLDLTASRYIRLADQKRDRTPDQIGVWRPVPGEAATIGQSLYSVLAAVGTNTRREELSVALVPIAPSDHPLELYIKARYGCLNEKYESTILSRSGFKYDLTLDDFLRVERVQLDDSFLDFVMQEPSRYGARDITPLIDYSLIGLAQQAQGRTWPEYADGSVAHDAQYLLILSEENSVEDFCWFWNLRAQRYLLPDNRLPLWLPREIAEARKDDIARLFQRRRGGSFPEGYLISKTVSHKELQSLAQKLDEGIVVATDDLDRFYGRGFFLGIRDQQEVFFDEGRVRVPVPQGDVVRRCQHPQYY